LKKNFVALGSAAVVEGEEGGLGWLMAEVEKRISPLRGSQKREPLRSK
jgi:hypothetical protein